MRASLLKQSSCAGWPHPLAADTLAQRAGLRRVCDKSIAHELTLNGSGVIPIAKENAAQPALVVVLRHSLLGTTRSANDAWITVCPVKRVGAGRPPGDFRQP